jgi:hypothetical protein
MFGEMVVERATGVEPATSSLGIVIFMATD